MADDLMHVVATRLLPVRTVPGFLGVWLDCSSYTCRLPATMLYFLRVLRGHACYFDCPIRPLLRDLGQHPYCQAVSDVSLDVLSESDRELALLVRWVSVIHQAYCLLAAGVSSTDGFLRSMYTFQMCRDGCSFWTWWVGHFNSPDRLAVAVEAFVGLTDSANGSVGFRDGLHVGYARSLVHCDYPQILLTRQRRDLVESDAATYDLVVFLSCVLVAIEFCPVNYRCFCSYRFVEDGDQGVKAEEGHTN